MVGDKLKEILKGKGITQRKLSNDTGVNYNTLSKIVNNKITQPSIETLKDIATYLGVNYMVFFADNEKPMVSANDYLDFHSLGSVKFRNLIYAYLEASSAWVSIEDGDGPHDGGRDIIAYELIGGNRNEKQTLFQVKAYKKINVGDLTKEIDTIHKNEDLLNNLDKIIFCLACEITFGKRDKIRKYAKDNNMPSVEFWSRRELHGKVTSMDKQPLITEFFDGSTFELIYKVGDIKDDIKNIDDKSLEILKKLDDHIKPHSYLELVDMELAKKLINQESGDEVFDDLIHDIKTLENKDPKNSKLFKMYNYIGIIYFKKMDLDKAINFFNKSKLDSLSYFSATSNLALAYMIKYLSTKDKTHINNGYDLVKALIKDSEIKGLEFIGSIYATYIRTLVILGKKTELKDFLDNEFLNKKVSFYRDENFFEALAIGYATSEYNDEAYNIINEGISCFPDTGRLCGIKGDLLLTKAIGHGELSTFEVFPKVISLSFLEDALVNFSISLEKDGGTDATNNEIMAKKILVQTLIAHEKGEFLDDFHNRIKKLDHGILSPQTQHNIKTVEIQFYLDSGEFDNAFKLMEDNISESDVSEIIRLSNIFLNYGSPEKAISLLDRVKDLDKGMNEIWYWIILSSGYAMINEKVKVYQIVNKGKLALQEKEEDYKTFNKHALALLMRSGQESAERFVENTFQFQKKFPDEKILTPIKAIEDSGSLSKELSDFLGEAKDRYVFIKKWYLENPVPVYFLRSMYNKPYPELFSFGYLEGDFDFISVMFNTDKKLRESFTKYFNSSKKIIFDYLSLYHLSRANMLGVLKDLGKELYIHKELFYSIQNDLLEKEDSVLRKLWDFLRHGNLKMISECIDDKKNTGENLSEPFGDGMWNTYKYVLKNKDYLFVCDDFNTVRLSNTEGIKCSDSLVIANILVDIGSIDKRQYSFYINEIAKSFPIFVPFDIDDLYTIYSDDVLLRRFDMNLNSDISTTRSFFHLIRQILLPDIKVDTFLGVFYGFLTKLIKSGFTFQDKLNALLLINIQIESLYKNIFGDLVKNNDVELVKKLLEKADVKNISQFHSVIRKTLIDSVNKEELILIKTKLQELQNEDGICNGVYNIMINYIETTML